MNNYCSKFFLAIILFLFASTLYAQFQRIPIQDAFIHNALPNNNFGSSTLLTIEDSDIHGLGLSVLQFDLSSLPENAIVLEAALSLECFTSEGDNVRMFISSMRDSWDEATITWDIFTNLLNPYYYEDFGVGPEGQSKHYDVFPVVKDWVNGVRENYGFAIGASNQNTSATFHSKEAGSIKAPRLFIDYAIPPEPPANLIASDGSYTNFIRLNWEPVSGAAGYDVYRSNSSNSSSASKIASGSFSGATEYDDFGVSVGQNYYYWVKSYIIAGGNIVQSDFSNLDVGWLKNQITPPSKPINPLPSHGASNISISSDISWENGGGASTYKVYFGTDPTPDNGEYKGVQSNTSYDPGTLNVNTTYYWRINSVNSGGETEGNIWSFSTVVNSSSGVIWEDGFATNSLWVQKLYQGDGSFNSSTFDGENVCILNISGSPGVLFVFKELTTDIPSGSKLKARWFYESSGAYNNSENSDGGQVLFVNSIPNTQSEIVNLTIQNFFSSVDYPMYQWNEEEFVITQNIDSGSYIGIGGAVWPSYIINNWDYIKIYSPETSFQTNIIPPNQYKLFNNFPNPFNPSTKIRFYIPESNFVTLTIYDNLGRMISEVVKTSLPRGFHEYEFIANNLSTGIYFCELRSNEFREVKKIALLK